MYQSSKRLVTYKEYSCFDYSDFPAHSVFTSDVCWDSLGTSIFGNSSSAACNTRSRLPSRLSFLFLWLWPNKEAAIQFSVLRSTLSTWNQPISTIVCWIDCFWIFWTNWRGNYRRGWWKRRRRKRWRNATSLK